MVITGAASGIGRALSQQLAQAGCDLVLNARREVRLQALADDIARAGRRAVVVAGDITQTGVREACLRAAQQELGGLDILVNNAGIGALGSFVDASEERLRRVMEVNFFAPVELTVGNA